MKIEPEMIDYYLPFLTKEGEVLSCIDLSLFYRFDASKLGIVELGEDSAEFTFPSSDTIIQLDDLLRASLEGLGPGSYIFDLEREVPIWSLLDNYPLHHEEFQFTPLIETTFQAVLITSYSGNTAIVDPHGYHQLLAYLKHKISPLTPSSPTVYGVILLAKIFLGKLGVEIPDDIIKLHLTKFTPRGNSTSKIIKPAQMHEVITSLAVESFSDDTEDLAEILGEIIVEDFEDVSEEKEPEDELFDGIRYLSTLAKLPPDKWTNSPQERLKIKQDIVLSPNIFKIMCRGDNLIFHTTDSRTSPSSIIKELNMPVAYTPNVVVVIKEAKNVLL